MASWKAFLVEDIKVFKGVMARLLWLALSFFFLVMALNAYNATATMPLALSSILSAAFFFLCVRE
jgi:hypothetical protein